MKSDSTNIPATPSLVDPVVIDSRMLSEQVATHLFRQLVSGRLRGGQRINEAELARTLGISRNPIREAIRKLEERGLLVSAPRRGTFVRSFSKQDMADIFSFRTVIEAFAIRQALPRMTPEDHAELRGIVQKMVDAAKAGNEMALVEADNAFHLRIVELSGNSQTLRGFLNIRAEVQMSITLVKNRFESLEAAAVDHWPIIDAIDTRDEATAVKALEEHIQEAWRRISAAYPEADADE
ncbi:GntR family transcriptional regulator [Pararobbsia silviterrae]|uniref:GntR family transcriptional regulator n=1 Tax=Pararobbsia silviterrae TaxID=1792498 RepID=A0A494YE93_9BURK|nr:GntR family transcriptional regulator [Pararobbsia silviterrae]RKP58663.1 GntR family transcriptional regulator [Pararobbsia silviterrae]